MSKPLAKEQADKLKNQAALASILVAVTLCLLKVFGAFVTDSLAVLSSMVDSLSDIFASLITLIAVRYSAKPASATHRYGYGKAEALSALTQSAFIAGSGLFVMYDGFSRLVTPRPISETGIGLIIMIISVIVTIALIIFQRHIAHVTKSQAILADSAHYVVDIMTNSSIILSLLVVQFFDTTWFDSVTAILISAFLLFNAYELACDAIAQLLDKELDDGIRADIKEIVDSFHFTRGIHDLRSRDLGGNYLFEFHLELDGSIPLFEAHHYSDMVSEKIHHAYPDSQVIIHQDPAGIKEDRLDNQISESAKKGKNDVKKS